MMKRLMAVVALMALAIPATAADVECVSVGISDGLIVSRSGVDDGSIRTDLVGSFLQVQYGHAVDSDTSWLADDIVSVEIDDEVLGAEICSDGVVTLVRDEVADVEAPASPSVADEVDLTVEFPEIVIPLLRNRDFPI